MAEHLELNTLSEEERLRSKGLVKCDVYKCDVRGFYSICYFPVSHSRLICKEYKEKYKKKH